MALAVGNTVQNAFDIGKQAVAAAPNVPNSATEGEKFLLLPDGADHNKAIFEPPAWAFRYINLFCLDGWMFFGT